MAACLWVPTAWAPVLVQDTQAGWGQWASHSCWGAAANYFAESSEYVAADEGAAKPHHPDGRCPSCIRRYGEDRTDPEKKDQEDRGDPEEEDQIVLETISAIKSETVDEQQDNLEASEAPGPCEESEEGAEEPGHAASPGAHLAPGPQTPLSGSHFATLGRLEDGTGNSDQESVEDEFFDPEDSLWLGKGVKQAKNVVKKRTSAGKKQPATGKGRGNLDDKLLDQAMAEAAKEREGKGNGNAVNDSSLLRPGTMRGHKDNTTEGTFSDMVKCLATMGCDEAVIAKLKPKDEVPVEPKKECPEGACPSGRKREGEGRYPDLGNVVTNELLVTMRALGFEEEEIRNMAADIDDEGCDSIDYDDFSEWILHKVLYRDPEQPFRLSDYDETGKIPLKHFKRVAKELGERMDLQEIANSGGPGQQARGGAHLSPQQQGPRR